MRACRRRGDVGREQDRQHLAGPDAGLLEVEGVERRVGQREGGPGRQLGQPRAGGAAEAGHDLVDALEPVGRRDVVVADDQLRIRLERPVDDRRPDGVVQQHHVARAHGQPRHGLGLVAHRLVDVLGVDGRRVAGGAQHVTHRARLVRDRVIRCQRGDELVDRPHAACSSAVSSAAAVASHVSVAACARPRAARSGPQRLVLHQPGERRRQRVGVAGTEPQRCIAGGLVQRGVVGARDRDARGLRLDDGDAEALEQRRPAEGAGAREHAGNLGVVEVAGDQHVVGEAEPLDRPRRRAAVPAGRADQHQRELGMRCAQQREPLDQRHQVLAGLVRAEARDVGAAGQRLRRCRGASRKRSPTPGRAIATRAASMPR